MNRVPMVLILSAILLVLTNCSSQTAGPAASPPSIPADPSELVKQYYRDVFFRPPSTGLEFLYFYDRPTFMRQHRDEMLRTLEVVETAELDSMAASFTRYSIGANIYRKVVWLRKVDGQWRVSQKTYFSEYSDDPGADWKSEKAKALLSRVKDWEEKSKAWW